MARIHAKAERIIDAGPTDVWAALTDYTRTRPQILPDNYQDYHAEQAAGESGATVTYRLRAGGRERSYRMRVEEVTPEQEIIERDEMSSFTTHWLMERVGPGEHTRVRLSSEWDSRASGVSGFFERRFAPSGVRRIHEETLLRLSQLMRER